MYGYMAKVGCKNKLKINYTVFSCNATASKNKYNFF